MIDNASLMIGIAFSCASLMVALVIGWIAARRETYLVLGALGMALAVAGLVIMSFRGSTYDSVFQIIPFSLLETGIGFIYAGSRLFNNRQANLVAPVALTLAFVVLTALPLALGFSGVGTIMLNISAAILLGLCAGEYWRTRHELRVVMLTNVVLYSVSGLSFLACALVLLFQQQWVLDAPPQNLAESINSIAVLVGVTGIGATTLTLHYARAASFHRNAANTDDLTGVLNRRALFSEYREDDLVPGLAVLMFDLDHFKQINDHFGHARGDQVLQEFADVLRAHLRATDIITRLGGEEFCAVMPGVDRDTARAIAERIRLAFAEKAFLIDTSAVATVSIGLAIGEDSETFASVLSRADDALYKAKKAGRNQVALAKVRLVA
ncbi:MAG: GGDEF domain-containing protein [Phyllobacteriaceae bacterium]|nr:GGDEF domain-containing protein [Phyllobacteriaceae bacterium]